MLHEPKKNFSPVSRLSNDPPTQEKLNWVYRSAVADEERSQAGQVTAAAQNACTAKKVAEATKASAQREANRRAARTAAASTDEAWTEDRKKNLNYRKEAVRIQEKLDEAREDEEEYEKERLEKANKASGFVPLAASSQEPGSINLVLLGAFASAWAYVGRAF